jgi:PAS domain-containing protein
VPLVHQADPFVVRVVGTQLDITARKAAESALMESERKFRSLFERSPVGIALSDYRTRRFLQVNVPSSSPAVSGAKCWR